MEMSSPYPLLRHQEASSFMAGPVPLNAIIYSLSLGLANGHTY